MIKEVSLKSISDVSAKFGLTYRALRYYEARGLLRPLRKDSGRFFDTSDQCRIALIVHGRKLGFSLSEIKKLIGPIRSTPVRSQSIVDYLTGPMIADQIRCLRQRHEFVVAALDELKKQLQNLK